MNGLIDLIMPDGSKRSYQVCTEPLTLDRLTIDLVVIIQDLQARLAKLERGTIDLALSIEGRLKEAEERIDRMDNIVGSPGSYGTSSGLIAEIEELRRRHG